MSLSNFSRKKAGKLDANAGFWEIWELEVRQKFDFWEILWYNKRLGIELGTRVSPKAKSEFEIS